MAKIRPFQAWRPAKGREQSVAALPYDVYSSMEARAAVEGRPDSFLHVDRPELFFEPGHDMYAPEVYEHARTLLWDMAKRGVFVKEERPCYYLYRQTMNGHSQTGIVGCAAVDDYVSGVIKKHENTRAEKEEDRIRHVTACGAQTGPIFLAYRRNEALSELIARKTDTPPEYDFVSEDGIGHTGWVIADDEDIRTVQDAFDAMDSIYIADGHHRCASAVKVGLAKREEHPDYDGNEEFNSFLSVLFPDEELTILDYNRVVKDLGGLTKEQFLARLKEHFTVEFCGAVKVKPDKKGIFGMVMEDGWYRLVSKRTEQLLREAAEHPVEALDVSVLQNDCLAPILGITDPKTDRRIDFVGGIRGLEELERRVREDCAVAFAMYPTSIDELFAVADKGLLMPPKSTWFEPKLRSGLYIHQF
ncbi:MAG: DUF1015 domain-containing protein [Lachnospiraceae bacterium]|nr:DUF1015 domain-containing protein [Lachnospiraceae bacterium]